MKHATKSSTRPKKSDLAVIGLATMGANLARNAVSRGFGVAVYNRTPLRTEEFMKAHAAEGTFTASQSLPELCSALASPRIIMLMVKAGDAVDEMIAELLPHLSAGDMLIDGGNSHYVHTMRRQKELAEQGMHLIGMGISGGEEGALRGPSMMPGGDKSAWEAVAPVFTAMAADDGGGGKCVTYIGPGGSGHFVKMVHNGIEYAVMQIIAEVYDFLLTEGVSPEELSALFAEWNTGDMQSFLLEITAAICAKKDTDSGLYLLDVIKDSAGQKGTGKWTTEAAMDLGVAIPTITAAVDARILSSHPDRRKQIAGLLPHAYPEPYPEQKKAAELARSAFDLSSLLAYAQGFDMLRAANEEYAWNINLADVARIWRGGCIIRAKSLELFQHVFGNDESVSEKAKHALLDRFLSDAQLDWRRFIAIACGKGVPIPAVSASLSYYDTVRRSRLPQNLTQAQRDFFGAHTYERIDREGTFHTDWKE